jgi:4-amino-4-deoxy-L-arabinose transferase-like glycosyltransferase
LYGSQTTLPVAGPELSTRDGFAGIPGGVGQGGYKPGFVSGKDRVGAGYGLNQPGKNAASTQLIKFLQSKKQNEKYLVAVQDANSAAPIILETGEAVMAVGGFSGSDNILTIDQFSQLVQSGQIRYFLMNGRGMMQQSGITEWVQANGIAVNIDNGSGFNSGTLYDLAHQKG